MIKKSIPLLFMGLAALGGATQANAATEIRMSWWGGNGRHEATNAAVNAFEKANPGIVVKAEYTGWNGHLERLTTQIAGNTEPDLMQTNWNWMPIFSRTGDGFKNLLDYADIIDLDQFDPAALALGTNNGKLNGIPVSMTARVFYYNKDTWTKAGLKYPKTFADLMAAGPVFQKKLGEDYYPVVMEWRDVIALNRSYMVQKYGIPMIDEKNKKFAYSDKQMVEFFQMYADMVKQHVVPSTKYIASFGAGNLYEYKPWINGEWGGVYMWNTAANKYQDNLKPPMSLELGEYPMLPGATDSGLFYKPSLMLSIGKNSKHDKEAAKLLNYLLNEKAGIETMALARGVPLSEKARELLTDDGTLQPTDLSVSGLAQIDSLPKKLTTSAYFENPQLVSLFKELIEQMDQGTKTVAEAAKDFTKQGERILRKAMR
ncbi:ABC transporter substrate-binding protein [Gynuella sunshinyii]|uniref:ABC-type sugar transport system, periplasmic component n=1 Tax=Gynuella sunshinyii YC6258 TaxID=1445510 RepID=A0A0C5VIP1_9GAMM|nr:ABC transporter substrate-binding protein [Gynuella sunshinyii]AJQ93208.1 ABC-type sugar transport system, periplasmic component [Gynuella sunshinyii YC6258]